MIIIIHIHFMRHYNVFNIDGYVILHNVGPCRIYDILDYKKLHCSFPKLSDPSNQSDLKFIIFIAKTNQKFSDGTRFECWRELDSIHHLWVPKWNHPIDRPIDPSRILLPLSTLIIPPMMSPIISNDISTDISTDISNDVSNDVSNDNSLN